MSAVPDAPVHVPVLRERILELLAPALESPDRPESADRPVPANGPVLVDGTLGLGGHAEAFLERFGSLRLIGIDRDPAALEFSRRRLARFGERVTFVHAVYDEILDVLERLDVKAVQGILLDLGVSSMQLDETERGFAYSKDVALDMRMDPTRGSTAADVLNEYPADELARILRTYGEERFAKKIADAIVRARSAEPFTTSARLVALLHDVVPKRSQISGGHPAKRTFQALRIEVNGELSTLERTLPAAVDALAVDGRFAVLAYHSLEDRMVKRAFAALAKPDVPDGLPDIPAGHEAILRLVTRGAEKPDAVEVRENPRASSARLRVAQRIRAGHRETGATT